MVRHVILASYFAWGHLRPECALAVTLVRKFADVIISFIVDCDFTVRANEEMGRQCVSDAERSALLARIRVISAGRTHAGASSELMAMIMHMDPRHLQSPSPEACGSALKMIAHLMAEEAFEDDVAAKWEPVGSVPKLVIGDIMMGHVLLPTKQKYDVWLMLWWVGTAAAFTRLYGPHERGGRASGYVDECNATEKDEKLSNGRSYGDIARDTWMCSLRVPDNVIRIAGLPPYNQWEDCPQEFWFPTLYDAMGMGEQMMKVADGFLLPTVATLEPEAFRDIVNYTRPRRVLCLGPQLPPAVFSGEAHKATLDTNYNMDHPDVKVSSLNGNSTANGKTNGASNGVANGHTNGHAAVDPSIAFLDKALEEHGAHSAIYISFGSVFFPPAMHMKVLLETLLSLEKPMPIIITTSRGSVPPELLEQLETTGKGLVVSWAPQQAILGHPGLGWMVSHCGGGGTFESLSQGVPVIAWPFAGDQPTHALQMSEVFDSGFELLQVRTGAGKMKALRGGPEGTVIVGTEEAIRAELLDVLARAQGKEGARKRANAKAAQAKILDAIRPGGSADRSLEELDPIM